MHVFAAMFAESSPVVAVHRVPVFGAGAGNVDLVQFWIRAGVGRLDIVAFRLKAELAAVDPHHKHKTRWRLREFRENVWRFCYIAHRNPSRHAQVNRDNKVRQPTAAVTLLPARLVANSSRLSKSVMALPHISRCFAMPPLSGLRIVWPGPTGRATARNQNAQAKCRT